MKTYIALLRGINVGGSNKLLMRDLVDLLEGLGMENVKTYIQSGNVVLQSADEDAAALSLKISETIMETHGFAPRVLLLDAENMKNAIASNPFPNGEQEPKTLHLFFMDSAPQESDLEPLENVKSDGERFELIGNVFYLYAPEGIGRSKIADGVEKTLGVPVTARNWRTVSKIVEIARELV